MLVYMRDTVTMWVQVRISSDNGLPAVTEARRKARVTIGNPFMIATSVRIGGLERLCEREKKVSKQIACTFIERH